MPNHASKLKGLCGHFFLSNYAVSYLKEYFWSSLDFRYETLKFVGGGGPAAFSSGPAGRMLNIPDLYEEIIFIHFCV